MEPFWNTSLNLFLLGYLKAQINPHLQSPTKVSPIREPLAALTQATHFIAPSHVAVSAGAQTDAMSR